MELFEVHRGRNTSASIEEIMTVLLSLLETYDQGFFIIDALDECTEEKRWLLVDHLRELSPHVRIMLTSRFLDSIEEELSDFNRLDIKANKADLELFIDFHIRKNKHLQRMVQKSPPIRSEIKAAVVRTAEDMYEYLHGHCVSRS